MYGCHNRPPLGTAERVVQDGYRPVLRDGFGQPSLLPFFVDLTYQNSADCSYTHSAAGRTDPSCVGCRWRAPDTAHADQA